MKAVFAAARAALTRRKRQGVIVGLVVLISAATGVLAVALLVQSHGPYDRAFAAQNGAHLTATVRKDVSTSALSATSSVAGVQAVAGPYDVVNNRMKRSDGSIRTPEGTIVGRGEQNPAVDRISLDEGAWLTGPGQIVISRDFAGPAFKTGNEVVIGENGPKLKVVGIATSVTGTADAWVWPTQSDVLQQDTLVRQVHYRFAAAGTEAEMDTAIAALTSALPKDALLAGTSHLTVRVSVDRNLSAFVPFVVAFAVLGIVLSILITTNVVNGAVVSGFRTIGILKTLGFTPGQVVGVYVAQVVVPAVIGAGIGVILGALLAIPVLSRAERAYDLPLSEVTVKPWVIALVIAVAPVMVALAAIGPASRAGRLPAVQAIAVGRAPRVGRGFKLRRALTATSLPRPVALGLGLPLSRPSRALGTVVALTLGSVTLIFAIGLSASLFRIQEAFTRVGSVPVAASVLAPREANEGPPPPPAEPGTGRRQGGPPRPTSFTDPAVVVAKALTMPGTAHAVIIKSGELRVIGLAKSVEFDGFDGDGSWTGNVMLSGRWYRNAGEVIASTFLLRQTGYQIGDKLTFYDGRVVTIVGEYLDGDGDYTMLGDVSLAPADSHSVVEIGLTEGTDPTAYAKALEAAFPFEVGVFVDNRTLDSQEETFIILNSLIALLALLICSVAGLGVLNTVVLTTRERIHDIGVLKAIGMTPRQTRIMIVTSMVGLGLFAGAVAVPFGVALQRRIVPIMGEGAGISLPQSILDVYRPVDLVLLGCAGILIAILGALLPAGWAARTNVATALRAE